MAAVSRETSTRRARGRGGSRGAGTTSAPRGSRGSREPLDRVLAELDRMITALIQENRDLKRQIDRASRQGLDASSSSADRMLRSIQRRISRASDSGRTATRQRSTSTATESRTRRKITDPEVLERRRQALAKARAARAAKRAAAS